DDLTVKCWGENGDGQLGQGNKDDHGGAPGHMGDNLAPILLGTGRYAIAITAGGAHTCALLDDNTIKCWGKNDSGQLGLGDNYSKGDDSNEMGDFLSPLDLGTGFAAVAVVAGYSHTCALSAAGGVKCWGSNDVGQLGLGDSTNRGVSWAHMGNE